MTADDMPSLKVRNVHSLLSGLLNFPFAYCIEHRTTCMHFAAKRKHIAGTLYAEASPKKSGFCVSREWQISDVEHAESPPK
jgi:hypothetical protein